MVAAGAIDHRVRLARLQRFSRVLERVDGITEKVLTATLRHLERDGFVSRRVYAQVPPRVEYSLTPLGQELYLRVDPLVEWARTKAHSFQAARLDFERRAVEANE